MKKIAFILILVLCISFVTACIPNRVLDSMTSPVGDLALPSLDYQLTLAKEGMTIVNLLETHMNTARAVGRGEYPVEREILNLEASIRIADDAISAVAILNVPGDDEHNTAELLRRMNNARNSLELYQEDLVSGDLGAIGGRVNLMKSDFSAIVGMMNP